MSLIPSTIPRILQQAPTPPSSIRHNSSIIIKDTLRTANLHCGFHPQFPQQGMMHRQGINPRRVVLNRPPRSRIQSISAGESPTARSPRRPHVSVSAGAPPPKTATTECIRSDCTTGTFKALECSDRSPGLQTQFYIDQGTKTMLPRNFNRKSLSLQCRRKLGTTCCL
jgi:hypothetical protein